MKKLLFALSVFAYSCTPSPVVTSVTPLQSNQCLYEVKGTVNYTFIMDCGAYKVGDKIN